MALGRALDHTFCILTCFWTNVELVDSMFKHNMCVSNKTLFYFLCFTYLILSIKIHVSSGNTICLLTPTPKYRTFARFWRESNHIASSSAPEGKLRSPKTRWQGLHQDLGKRNSPHPTSNHQKMQFLN